MHPGRDIIVIGASAGGVDALRQLIGALPARLPAAVFIVLHLWPQAKSALCAILQRVTPLQVKEPEHDQAFTPGHIYVAPPDHHMMLEPGRIVVVRGPRENHARPAINPLFRSAAAAFGPRVIGVVLTGTLDDGTAGLWAVKRCGGTAVVQDPADADFAEMPRNALEHVAVDHCVPLKQMASLLARLTAEPVDAPAPTEVPVEIRLNTDSAMMTPAQFDLDKVGKRAIFTCPECNGALWEIAEGSQLQFRCHVGHGFSPRVLEAQQNLVIEQSLWSALRALKESAELDERLAERTKESQLEQAAASYRRAAEEKKRQAEHLLEFIGALRASPAVSQQSTG